MPADALETLRQVNTSLRWGLVRLDPERSLCSSLRPKDLSAIASEILLARECLRCLSPNSASSAEFNKEVSEYRRNLQNLQQLLPDLHARLLAEKLRLEVANSHLSAATAWARANEKTL